MCYYVIRGSIIDYREILVYIFWLSGDFYVDIFFEINLLFYLMFRMEEYLFVGGDMVWVLFYGLYDILLDVMKYVYCSYCFYMFFVF